MDPGPLRDALTVVAGVATGTLSAAFGVGGTVISTPAIRALGASALLAVGTTLPSVLPSAAIGTVRYSREGLIRWDVVARTAPVGVVAAVGGSLLSRSVPGEGHWLMLFTAALLAMTAVRMRRPAPPHPDPVEMEAEFSAAPVAAVPDDHDEPDAAARPGVARQATQAARARARAGRVHPLVLPGIGAASGALSGLLGIGGGIVMVPAFCEMARIELKPAIATSLACVGILAIPGTITHAALGHIDWRFGLLLAVGVIPGARFGAAIVMRAADNRLRMAVSGFLGAIAVAYGVGELFALAN